MAVAVHSARDVGRAHAMRLHCSFLRWLLSGITPKTKTPPQTIQLALTPGCAGATASKAGFRLGFATGPTFARILFTCSGQSYNRYIHACWQVLTDVANVDDEVTCPCQKCCAFWFHDRMTDPQADMVLIVWPAARSFIARECLCLASACALWAALCCPSV